MKPSTLVGESEQTTRELESSCRQHAELLEVVKCYADRFVRQLGLPRQVQHLYDDIVQDTLIIADRRLGALNSLDPDALKAWTFATIFLVARGSNRAEMRRTAAWIRLRDAFENENVRAAFATQNDANADVLARALSALTEEDRKLLIGRVWNGLSTVELAALSGLSESNVRQRLTRARKRAREAGLEQKNQGFDPEKMSQTP